MISFIVGVFVGAAAGGLMIALLHSAKERDRVIEEFYALRTPRSTNSERLTR